MNWDEVYIKEWRELGFYYLKDNDLKQWWLMGSKKGLLNFIHILRSYASHPENDQISEHAHLGPHSYLKILTWDKPAITNNYIGGSLNDLKNLAELIEKKLAATSVGNVFSIGHDYAIDTEYTIRIFFMSDDFDPSHIEHPVF